MANFINFTPSINQTDVQRTSVLNFTVLDAYGTTQINTLNVSIDGFQVISNGGFVNGYLGSIFASVNKYVVSIYPKKPFLRAASEIQVIISVFDTVINTITYSFFTHGYNPPVQQALEEPINNACDITKPFFGPTDLGLVISIDAGTGTEVNLRWNTAYLSDQDNSLYYNLYYSESHETVFDGYPDFLINGTQATIWGLAPGDTNFFGVRATEFDIDFDYAGMFQAGPDMFFYPSDVNLDGDLDLETLVILTNSTVGFPNSGVLNIDNELIKYDGLTPTSFIATERGYKNSVASGHYYGSLISMFKGQEDFNTKICEATPTFQKPNYALTYVLGDGYGYDGYRDGYDGYAYNDGYLRFKQENINAITSPGALNDASVLFDRLDYCGTWRSLSPQSFMKGQCTSSYFGGAQVRVDAEGNRHLVKVPDVQTHMLQREELLLESTGEPFVLLRRMWTGMRCLCFMARREHPDARCPICFGTSFTQGYLQFFNPRRSDRRILVRIDPSTDDLNLIDRGGFEPMYEPDGWTLPGPQIKDRDILIRFIEDTLEEWRYEVLNVVRNKTLFAQAGAQKIKLKRLPKTDIIYQFPVVRNTAPYPGSVNTSVSSTPGIIEHSHQIIIPQNTNFSTFKGATLESERHNHIIYDGVVQTVLNHTHTL